jgi:acyl-CoA synthetase (AMP-forming)/AMP-acid ligase II
MVPVLRPFVRAKVDFASLEKKEGYVRSLPELIDFNAIHNPDYMFCIQARPDDSFIEVTCRQFKIAIGRCAQWITESLELQGGRNGETTQSPIALLMESDLGLLIYQFALISLGIPVRQYLFLSINYHPSYKY